MKINKYIAEIVGIFVADGCMQKDYICFWGNITEDVEYYDKTIKNLFKKAFKLDINPHPKKSNSVYGFYVCNKNILSYFNKILGFYSGNKTYTVRVPKIIMNSKNPEIWSSFLRGFCDCDGNLSFDKRRGNYRKILQILHTYPRIHMTSVSYNLIRDIIYLLERLGIKYTFHIIRSKKKNEKDNYLIQICGKNRLNLWIKRIGFNNPVQKTRYKIFKRYGFVPVNINLHTRKKILNGNINPLNFYNVDLVNLSVKGKI